ncbi:MAG: thiamine ABC transporter substrate-binding protein [Candidatus Micrarchaeota archaeon]
MELKIALTLVVVLLGAAILSWMGSGSTQNVALISTVSPTTQPDGTSTLTIYTYDGIASKYGLGPKIFPKFEKECGCKLNVIAKGDVGAMVSQLIFEKNGPKADVALGIDNTFKEKVGKEGLFEEYRPIAKGINDSFFAGDYHFIPFDWGYVAFVYDSEKIDAPKNLEELTEKKYARKIVIEDARTSSPGKVFLYWVASEYGERTRDYLERLRPNLLTIAPGWTEAYNLFLQGEAPIVLSYSTSPAYHIINENTTKYKAAIFPRMYRQIEYVGVAKGAKNQELAKKFVEFMLSNDAQEEIALGNYMYPARNGIKLPDAFNSKMPAEALAEIQEGDKWLKIWEEVFSN